VQLDQGARDGETETRSAVLARVALVDLVERLKDLLEMIGRDA
jgi:hypothetical protein